MKTAASVLVGMILFCGGCSKPETVIGLRCPVTIHYDNDVQGRSDRPFVEHYIVNIPDKSVTTYTDSNKRRYDACGNKPCKVTITDNLIRVEMNQRAAPDSEDGNAIQTTSIDRYSGQVSFNADFWTNDGPHFRSAFEGTCAKESSVVPKEHIF